MRTSYSSVAAFHAFMSAESSQMSSWVRSLLSSGGPYPPGPYVDWWWLFLPPFDLRLRFAGGG